MDTTHVLEVVATLCVQVSAIIAATFVFQRWLGDARIGCRLWTVCFVGIIAMVAAGLLLPHRRMFAFPFVGARETMQGIIQWQVYLTTAALLVWSLGVALALIRRAMMCWRLTQFLDRRCEELDASEWMQRLDIKTDSSIRLLTSGQIQGPFCWQLHRATMVLPANLLGEDTTTLRHVFLHEIEHLRTKHPMQHFLQGVCSILFWFHPAVWAAARGADLTREFLCDEVAAKTAGKFSAYLRTLAKVAERCGCVSCNDVPRGILAFGNQKSALIKRSDRLVRLAGEQPRIDPVRSWSAIGGLIVLIVIVQQVWLPTNVLASQRSSWSPWPTWTATALHDAFDVQVRDFESFEDRVQMHDYLSDDD
jgi:beta-lactamase regulating signal transducer with metallopeptidase domain